MFCSSRDRISLFAVGVVSYSYKTAQGNQKQVELQIRLFLKVDTVAMIQVAPPDKTLPFLCDRHFREPAINLELSVTFLPCSR